MANILDLRHGITDIYDISDIGEEQASRLGKKLSEFGIKTIYSSPLKRAVSTAQIVSDIINTDVKILENMHEMNLGEAEGMTNKESRDKYGAILDVQKSSLHLDFLTARIPGGESNAGVISRLEKFISYIKDKYDNSDVIALSSHGYFMTVTYYYFFKNIKTFKNCDFFQVEI